MIAYAEEMLDWEEWQRDYRFGVLLILPPPETIKQVDKLRAKYDPKSYSICAAHISVSDPLSRPMTSDLQDEIRGVLSTIDPFQLHYDAPQATTEYAGVYYPIRPQEPIDALKQALHRSSAFGGDTHERRNIPAHMTIAEFVSIEDSLKLCDTIRGTAPVGSFRCDKLSYVVPDERFCFREAKSFPLGVGRANQRRAVR